MADGENKMNSQAPVSPSPPPVLEDFREDIYKNFIRMKEPVTSAKSYLRKSRRMEALNSIDKALSLSYEEQEKIMEALTDFVAEKDFPLDKWEDRLEDIEEILEKRDIFRRLEGEFEKFNREQQEDILQRSLESINREAAKLEDAVRTEMLRTETMEERRGLLVLGESFELMRKLSDQCLEEQKYDSVETVGLLILLLKLEALRREKISYESIERTVFELGRNIKSVESHVDDSIFRVLRTNEKVSTH